MFLINFFYGVHFFIFQSITITSLDWNLEFLFTFWNLFFFFSFFEKSGHPNTSRHMTQIWSNIPSKVYLTLALVVVIYRNQQQMSASVRPSNVKSDWRKICDICVPKTKAVRQFSVIPRCTFSRCCFHDNTRSGETICEPVDDTWWKITYLKYSHGQGLSTNFIAQYGNHRISVTEVLREIKIGQSEDFKFAILTYLEVPNFDFHECLNF